MPDLGRHEGKCGSRIHLSVPTSTPEFSLVQQKGVRAIGWLENVMLTSSLVVQIGDWVLCSNFLPSFQHQPLQNEAISSSRLGKGSGTFCRWKDCKNQLSLHGGQYFLGSNVRFPEMCFYWMSWGNKQTKKKKTSSYKVMSNIWSPDFVLFF